MDKVFNKITIVVTLIGWLLFSVASNTFTYGFAVAGLAGLIYLYLFIIMTVFTFYFLLTKKFNKLAVLLAVFMIMVTVSFFGGRLNGHLKETSNLKGDKIFTAIQNYRDAKGKYPSDLLDLTPDYLEKIPKPDFFRSDFYSSFNQEKDVFSVSYDAPAWLICARSSDKNWVCDD